MRPSSLARAAVAALALAGCSRDLTLPPPPGAAVVSAVVPSSAFSGELIELQGGPFDDDPGGNLVTFPHGSARAEQRTASGIKVRVPADAGSGPLGVTTRAGASAPTPPFTWRGLGQLRGASVTAQKSLLVDPTGLHVVRGSLVIESSLVQALVNLGRTSPSAPFSQLQRTAGGRAAESGVALYTAVEDAAGPALHRVDVASGAVAASDPVAQPVGCAPRATTLGFVAGASGTFAGDLVVAVCTSGFFATTFAIWPATPQPGGWAPLADFAPPPDTLGGSDLILGDPMVDAGGGQLLTVARSHSVVPRLALFDFGASPPTVRFLASPSPSSYTGPFALGQVAGLQVAAAATFDQKIAVVGTDDPSLLLGSYETRFTRNADLVAVTTGGTVAAASAQDGLVVGIPLAGGFAGGRVQWGYRVDGPTALRADGHLVWVASATTNEVVALDEATGSVVARRSAEPATHGLAYFPARPGFGGADVVTAGIEDLEAFVDWPIGAPTASGALLDLPGGGAISPGVLAAAPGQGVVWAAGIASILLDGSSYGLTTTARAPATPLPMNVADVKVLGDEVVVLHQLGVSIVDGSGRHDAFTTDYGNYAPLAVGPDGRMIIGRTTPSPGAQVWSLPELLAAGAPDATAGIVYPVVGGAWIDGEPWLLYGGGGFLSFEAARVAPDGTLVDAVPATVAGPFVPSPNGRTLAAANPSGRGVLVWSADPQAGFPVVSSIDVDGSVMNLAYDERGERLFALTRSPARIYVVE